MKRPNFRFIVHPLRQIKLDLEAFWSRFNSLSGVDERLELLADYAGRTYVFKHRTPLKERRNKFVVHAGLRRLLGGDCRVCGIKPVIRHHIIQLQNGGDNRYANIISICEPCHEAIHPHLNASQRVYSVPAMTEGDEALFREYRAVVG